MVITSVRNTTPKENKNSILLRKITWPNTNFNTDEIDNL